MFRLHLHGAWCNPWDFTKLITLGAQSRIKLVWEDYAIAHVARGLVVDESGVDDEVSWTPWSEVDEEERLEAEKLNARKWSTVARGFVDAANEKMSVISAKVRCRWRLMYACVEGGRTPPSTISGRNQPSHSLILEYPRS